MVPGGERGPADPGECVQGCLDLSHLLSELDLRLFTGPGGRARPARPASPRPAPVRLAACDVGGSQAAHHKGC